MVTYPHLSQAEQATLPPLIQAPTVMPAKFADSTHQLWHCETVDGAAVLKVCNHTAIQQSSFWQGLNRLFGIDFPKHLEQTLHTATLINQHGAIPTPTVIGAANNRYVFTQYLAGTDLDHHLISDTDVQLLGQHIGQLHQQTFTQWGALHAPSLPTAAWPKRLHDSLKWLADHSGLAVPQKVLEEALALALELNETTFVPIMPDLRWDQFRRSSNGTLTLMDLDAYVIGPSTLELVLILYLLTPSQLALFKASYSQHQPWPDLSTQLPCYQLLLFLLHVLGETDYATWLKRMPHHTL